MGKTRLHIIATGGGIDTNEHEIYIEIVDNCPPMGGALLSWGVHVGRADDEVSIDPEAKDGVEDLCRCRWDISGVSLFVKSGTWKATLLGAGDAESSRVRESSWGNATAVGTFLGALLPFSSPQVT